jgi:enoyl-CoA hydratase
MLLVEPRDTGVTHLVLNRPDRFNALATESVEQLHTALTALARDRLCRVVVLRGAGKHFCAGADLDGHGVAPGGDGSHSPQDWMAVQQHIAGLVPRLRALPQPVIAAVHGAASGGGFALALASDIRICTADARFNAAFVRVGLSGCDVGVSWLLPRVIGCARAFEAMLTGRFIAADEAERIGLVSRVVPAGDLVDLVVQADEIAAAIVANSPYGVRMTKKVMWAQLETGSLQAGLALEDATQVSAAMSADHVEAISAFRDRRDPRFENR